MNGRSMAYVFIESELEYREILRSKRYDRYVVIRIFSANLLQVGTDSLRSQQWRATLRSCHPAETIRVTEHQYRIIDEYITGGSSY